MIFSSFHFRLYYQKCREVKLCFYSVSQAYRLFFLPKNLPAAASIAANPKSSIRPAFPYLLSQQPFHRLPMVFHSLTVYRPATVNYLDSQYLYYRVRICREFRICRWIRLRFFQTFYRFLQFFQCLIHIFFYCIFSKL